MRILSKVTTVSMIAGAALAVSACGGSKSGNNASATNNMSSTAPMDTNMTAPMDTNMSGGNMMDSNMSGGNMSGNMSGNMMANNSMTK